MVTQRETKTRAGERRTALDRTFLGADFDETDEVDDETEEGAAIRVARGLPIESLSPKEIIRNPTDAVSAKLGVGKLKGRDE